jgi:hypothetical protein
MFYFVHSKMRIEEKERKRVKFSQHIERFYVFSLLMNIQFWKTVPEK